MEKDNNKLQVGDTIKCYSRQEVMRLAAWLVKHGYSCEYYCEQKVGEQIVANDTLTITEVPHEA